LDEAQELIDQFHNKFTSTTKENETQPLYSLVVRTFQFSAYTCVIPSGTSLTMKSLLNITGHIMKGSTWNHEKLNVIKNGFDSVDSQKFPIKFRFPCVDHCDIMQWLVGRVRFATTFIEEWLVNYDDINTLFKKFKENYTNPDSDKSIMVKIDINSIIIKEETALELFEYGVALLCESDVNLQISISEPFVIESALIFLCIF
jgi:hypothetical protein